MKHQQILDKLAARGLVSAMDEELATWVSLRMRPANRPWSEVEAAVVPPVLARWRCLLDADDAKPTTKDVTRVALATVLHKYGFAAPEVTAAAETAIDDLNAEVALSDAFARQSPAIKEFLRSAPVRPTRRPRRPKAVTFFRAGDVVSFQVDGRFHGAYVLTIDGANEVPVIEFYAGAFTRPPTSADLSGRPAAAANGMARFRVAGMTHVPDPANQVVAVTGPCEPPAGGDPGPTGWIWTYADLLGLQHEVRTLFDDGGHA